MARFTADAIWTGEGGSTRLWHGRTGRSMLLSPAAIQAVQAWDVATQVPPEIRALVSRLDALHLLLRGPLNLARLIPAVSRLVLLLPGVPALWRPIPAVRTPGGFAYTERRLTAAELRLWRSWNGARTVAASAAAAGTSTAAALTFLAELTAPEVQAVQLRDAPARPRDLALERLVALPRPAADRPAHLYGAEGQTTLAHYHQAEITDGSTHFDDRETTVAHAFALPHPGLGGLPYGARLYQAMAREDLIPAPGGAVLEIGSGDGELGQAWRAAAAAADRLPAEHTRLDLSPALLETSGRRQPGTRGVLGTATALPFGDQSLDLVICNEVIADLEAVPLDAATPGSPAAAVAVRLARYGLASLPGRALYNLGAWQLLEELARVLRPGGAALLSEFGTLDEAPEETTQLDHPEVSIHFGHLLAVARALGLEARCVPLAAFLQVDLGAIWLSRWSYEALRARMRACGRHLAARAWTPDELALPWPVEGLQYVPLTEVGPGPLLTRFYALVVRRWGTAGSAAASP